MRFKIILGSPRGFGEQGKMSFISGEQGVQMPNFERNRRTKLVAYIPSWGRGNIRKQIFGFGRKRGTSQFISGEQ